MDTPRLRALSLPGLLALFLVQLHDVFLRLAAVSIGTFVPWPSITTFLPMLVEQAALITTGDRRYHSLRKYVCSLLQFGKNGWIAGQRCSAYARESVGLGRLLARHQRPLNAPESELSAVGQRPDLTVPLSMLSALSSPHEREPAG